MVPRGEGSIAVQYANTIHDWILDLIADPLTHQWPANRRAFFGPQDFVRNRQRPELATYETWEEDSDRNEIAKQEAWENMNEDQEMAYSRQEMRDLYKKYLLPHRENLRQQQANISLFSP